MMKKEQTPKCDPCERDFEHKVNELVKEGKTPTHMEHTKRGSEVTAAFGHTEKGHAGMEKKTPAKQPAMAGTAKMKK